MAKVDSLGEALKTMHSSYERATALIFLCRLLKLSGYRPWQKKPGFKQRSLVDWLDWLRQEL